MNGGAGYTVRPPALRQTCRMTGRVRRWLRDWRFVAVEAAASVVSVILFCLGLVLVPLMLITGGVLRTPEAVKVLRWWSDLARRRVGRRRAESIRGSAAVLPPGSTIDARLRFAFSREAGRDALWLTVHALPVLFLSLVTVMIPLGVVNSLAVMFYWPFAPADDPVTAPYPVTSWELAATMPLVALAYAVLSWWLIPAVARLLAWISARLLNAPPRTVLAERVDALTLSRAAALDAHAAELRRIERDLHDGAQNRLVSVVMMLGIAERALETGTGEALGPIRRARCTTSTRPSSTNWAWRARSDPWPVAASCPAHWNSKRSAGFPQPSSPRAISSSPRRSRT